MDDSLIEKYKKELLDMYNARTVKIDLPEDTDVDSGKLMVNVTSFRGLYPVPNAVVIVFTGDYDSMTEIDRSITDESGKTKTFILPTPDRGLSLNAGSTEPVYTNYGIKVFADGYADEINTHLPIFSGVTSIQNIDMSLLAAQNGNDTNIDDQAEEYNL